MKKSLAIVVGMLLLFALWYGACFARFEGRTRLMIASIQGRPGMVRLLLRLGADPNAIQLDHANAGATALHLAAEHGQTAVIRTLLAYGAEPNLQDAYGFTPLCWALYARAGTLATVQALLAGQAKLAWAHASFLAIACLGQPEGAGEKAELVMRAGSLQPASPAGQAFLAFYAAHGMDDVVRVFLEHGGDPNAPCPPMDTIGDLRFAAAGTHPSQFAWRRLQGKTPLMSAAASGHLSTVQLLVSRGADPGVRDTAGKTALDFATELLSQPEDPLRQKAQYQQVVSLLRGLTP